VARLLGYGSWAHYKLEIKMAKEPDRVREFLDDLAAKVAPKAQADLAALLESKRAHLGGDVDGAEVVDLWDWRYYTQRILKEHFDVDPFAVAEYFPLDRVLAGMFDLYQRLVGARFVRVPDAQAWHPDVQLFVVEDATTGDVVSHFYLDLHPRQGKYGHAAAFTLRGGRRLPDGSYQTPASAMVANFTKPTAGSPSLLRHSEVVTLFHEFGHILHQTLTTATYQRFAGTAVERDFVEAPSQMLEHWCWEPKVLASFARHYETGEAIPADLIDRMVAAKNVSSGIATNRQLYFGLLDMAYHGPGAQKDTDAIAAKLHAVTGFDFPDGTHFQGGFGHLFGYDAGYYGYMWSKVFGDDMYTRFETVDVDAVDAVGRDYRQLILERGGTVDGDVLVRDFLGREPETAAFLRDLGLEA
jgi:Zn-dependent oligopeptidase